MFVSRNLFIFNNAIFITSKAATAINPTLAGLNPWNTASTDLFVLNFSKNLATPTELWLCKMVFEVGIQNKIFYIC